MKSLKSQLAKDLLADDQARNELRRFLVSNRTKLSLSKGDAVRIQFHSGGSAVTVTAAIVPKAKA